MIRPSRLVLVGLTGLAALQAGGTLAQPQSPLLQLRMGSFDPRTETSPPAGAMEAAPLRPGLEDRYRLVQFSEKITPAVLAQLERSGMEVLDYVPSQALIVRLAAGGASASAFDSIVDVRWWGPLEARYKLDPDLAVSASEQPAERLALDVGLFANEDPSGIVAALEARFRTIRIEFVKTGARPRITLDVAPAEAASILGALASDPAVAWLSRAPELVPTNDQIAWIGQSFDTANGPTEAVDAEPMPYSLSGTVWNRGLHGEGQIIAVADTGLEHGMCYFTDPVHPVNVQNVAAPAPLALDFAHRKLLAVNAPSALGLLYDDWFRHGTHTSATAVADDLAHLAGGGACGHDHGDGVAPAAKLVFEDISGSQSSSCSTSIGVASLENLLLQEHRAGARVSSNSWGSTTTQADVTSFEADASVFDLEDMLVVVSAGNSGTSGTGSLNGLARCKNCLTVGASEHWEPSWPHATPPLHPDHMTDFSSRGPTADGRTKPDITAPGYRVDSARFPVQYFNNTSAPECDGDDPNVCFPGFGGCYVVDPSATCGTSLLNGTSQSTPAVAGLALLARQYFTEGFYPTGAANPADALAPTAALLKAALINGARNMTGRLYKRQIGAPDVDLGQLADAPSSVQGWGRATLDDVLYFPGESRHLRLFDLPHAAGLATDQHVAVTFDVTSSSEPLKLTLAWSDTPGTPIAFGALVNDLDLVLVAPDGRTYRGNQWTTDNVNVVGDMESRPNAAGRDNKNNVEGILIDVPLQGVYRAEVRAFQVTSGAPRQGAALVVTGDIDDCTDEAPPALAVAGLANGQVVLEWDPVPGAIGYEVLRNGTGCGQPLATNNVSLVPGAATVFGDASVSPATTYYYSVRAVTSAQGCHTADSTCVSVTTPLPGPPPVPDGTFGSPVRVAAANAAKTQLQLTWDATSCPATDYHVIHGSLSAVAALDPLGSVCDLGTSGSVIWTVPSGDLWFLVVSDNGASTEGSWGVDSSGVPRQLGVASGECSLTQRNDFASCH